jgi:hypothetical protein
MNKMSLGWLLVGLLGCHDGPDTTHLEKDLLHLEAKIPLSGVSGRIDHLAHDEAGHRLFVAALGNNTIEVVDLVKRSRFHSITGLHEPQGLRYIPGPGRLVAANAGDGACIFFDGQSYRELGRVALGDDADNVRYDGSTIYVGYGSGGIAVIDPVNMKLVGDLSLKAHPESFQLGDSGQVFINVPDVGEIVAGDLKTLSVRAHWKNSGASANFPMALDQRGGRLFVVYRHPAQLREIDIHSGAVKASAPCVGDADDVFYDTGSGLVFVTGGEGYIDVFRGATLVNHIPTRKGARTSLWLPAEKKLVVAVPARRGEEAAIWVYAM